MQYSTDLRSIQMPYPLIWLILTGFILLSGLIMSRYTFKVSLGIGSVQVQIEGSPGQAPLQLNPPTNSSK